MANPKLGVFLLLLVCISTTSDALKATMMHRHSLDSPLYQPNLTSYERLKDHIRISHSRFSSLAERVKNSSNKNNGTKSNDVIMRPLMKAQDPLYLVGTYMGTFTDSSPPFRFLYLGLDTGSDLTWTQCEGCNPCYPQTYPLYPATKSTSYNPIPCSACASVEGECFQDQCVYKRSYGDGSSLNAVAAQETFYFKTDTGDFGGLAHVIFGCGYSMTEFDSYGPNNEISGLLGMSYGSISLTERGSVVTHGKFSYCLIEPSKAAGAPSPMRLRWGDDVVESPDMKVTPMPRQQQSLYYLNLVGVSVGNVRLDVPPEVFKIKEDGTGGTIIDSGAGFSLLAMEAYDAFEKELDNTVLKMNENVRRMRPEAGLDICYERYKEPVRVVLPWVTLHFENNADFTIKPEGGYFIGFSDKRTPMICSLIINSTEEYERMTVLGAIQQINHRIVYDTQKGELRFAEHDCPVDN